MSNLVALHNHLHQSIRVNTHLVEVQGGQLNMVPVVLSEFLKLAVQFPIALTKNKETGQFVCVALFGFQNGENLFIKDNQWDSLYVPLQIRRQPFFLGESSQGDDQFVICIDSAHQSLQSEANETGKRGEQGEQGEQLFDAEGKETPYIENIKSILAELLNGESVTQAFINTLSELQLLQPMHLEITFENAESTRIEGMYTINEQRLNTLASGELSRLHQHNHLSPIYTMITSLGHIYGLIDRKNKRNAGK